MSFCNNVNLLKLMILKKGKNCKCLIEHSVKVFNIKNLDSPSLYSSFYQNKFFYPNHKFVKVKPDKLSGELKESFLNGYNNVIFLFFDRKAATFFALDWCFSSLMSKVRKPLKIKYASSGLNLRPVILLVFSTSLKAFLFTAKLPPITSE